MFHEDFFLSVAGALSGGVTEGDLFADELTVSIEVKLDFEITEMLWHGHL